MKNVGKFGAKLHDKIKNNFGTVSFKGGWGCGGVVLLCAVCTVHSAQCTAHHSISIGDWRWYWRVQGYYVITVGVYVDILRFVWTELSCGRGREYSFYYDVLKDSMTKRSRLWTLVSFSTGIILISISLILQSKRHFVYSPSILRSTQEVYLIPAIWRGVISNLLLLTSREINDRDYVGYVNDEENTILQYPSGGTGHPVVTRYEFDLTLVGDSEQSSSHHRSAFMWITAQIIDYLQMLDDANVAEVYVSRRVEANPVGALPYYRSNEIPEYSADVTGNDDGSGNLNLRQKSMNISNFNYFLESDVKSGRLPIMDLMDRTGYITSGCAADPGCKRFQILMYIPPPRRQPLYMISSLSSFLKRTNFRNQINLSLEPFPEQRNNIQQISITGISVTGTAALVIANFGYNQAVAMMDMDSTLLVLKCQIKNFLGLPAIEKEPIALNESSTNDYKKLSCGISRSDITYMKAARSYSIFQAASEKLQSLTVVRRKSLLELILSFLYTSTENDYDAARKSLLECEEIILRLHKQKFLSVSSADENILEEHSASKGLKDTVKAQEDTVKNAEDTLDEIHSLCITALKICNTLSSNPDYLFPSYFPFDQQLIMYAPYWFPLLVPILKGIKNLRVT